MDLQLRTHLLKYLGYITTTERTGKTLSKHMAQGTIFTATHKPSNVVY